MATRISKTKKIAAAALVDMGIPLRQVGQELGISKDSAAIAAYDPTLDEAEVNRVKNKLAGRMIVSADRFLSHGLDNIQDLGPYQAVLCAGIMHDHYLRATQAGKGNAAGGLTQILIQIDQSQRVTTISSDDGK